MPLAEFLTLPMVKRISLQSWGKVIKKQLLFLKRLVGSIWDRLFDLQYWYF